MADPKVPAYDIGAEQSLLGAICLDTSAVDFVLSKLDLGDFYRDAHRAILLRMGELRADGEVITLITLADRLKRYDELDTIGGMAYLTALFDAVPTAERGWLESHCNVVKEKSLRRQLEATGREAVGLAVNEDVPIAEQIDQLQDQLLTIQMRVSRRLDRRGFEAVAQGYWNELENIEEGGGKLGVYTGFKDLDRMTGGLRVGFYVVAAPTGFGKTAFAGDITRYVAIREQKTVLFYSLEMIGEQLFGRFLSAEASVPARLIECGRYEMEQLDRITAARDRLYTNRIQVWDTPEVTVSRMLADARVVQQNPPAGDELGLVVVDYLQLVKPVKETSSRTNDVSGIAQGLKNLAMLLRVPVIALAQYNNEFQKRKDMRPRLSDLRESGTIAHAADMVVFLHSPQFLDAQRREASGFDEDRVYDTEVIVAKHRHGPTGSFRLAFHRRFAKFREIPATLFGEP